MSFTNAAELSVLSIWLAAASWTNVAINHTTTPITAHWLSLATADPGETGTQATNEATYTDYARESVDRASGAGGFNIAANPVLLNEDHPFVQASGGTSTVTHFGIGHAETSTGTLDGSGTVTPNIEVATGVTPILTDATSFALD
jgi:hypothetical protein